MNGKKDLSWVALILAMVLFVGFGANLDKFWSNDGRVLSATTGLSLEERVASLESRVGVLESGKVAGPVGVAVEQFKGLAGGAASGTSWVKVAGSDFSLDPSLYGTIEEVSWQGWLEVKDGNGIGFARIYDATNHRGVDGSEIMITSKERASFYSSGLSVWRGINDYYIQVRSSSGYQISITEPKLRLLVR